MTTPANRSAPPESAATLARQFTVRYILSLAAVAILTVLGQVIIQTSLSQQESDSRVINLAGRQRMLSQRLAKAALRPPSPERDKELHTSMSSLDQVHRGLLFGDAELGLPGVVSPLVRRHFAALQPHLEGLQTAITKLLNAPEAGDSSAIQSEIRKYERTFINGMDAIVFALDHEARSRVSRLERLELALLALTLLVLFLEARFVFRPAVHRMFEAVSALLRARDALARAEAEQQATLSALPDGLARMAGDGRLSLLKPIRFSLFGGTHPAGTMITPDNQPAQLKAALSACSETIRQTGTPVAQQVVVPRDDPKSAYELRVARAQGTGHIVMIRDITKQRRLESEVLDATERTQAQVGRELHDGLCQHLAGIALLARAKWKDGDQTELVQLIEDALVQARELALGLYPSTLSNLGLNGALEELARHVETVSNLHCIIDFPNTDLDIPDDIALQLYRIAQEATANAIKHSEADLVTLRLVGKSDSLTLEVEDNGQGIENSQPGRKGLGLDTMEYRARLLNGDLSIVTSPSGGTLVRCRIETPDHTSRNDQ